MIEIYLLEQLAAFYECGTLSAAAEKLSLAQPSLSRSMQKLEESLGVQLFERRKNRIELTRTGVMAAEYAGRILDSEREMERQIRAYDRSLHTVAIGSCAPGPLMTLLPRVTGLFADQTITSAVEPEGTLIGGLEKGEYGLIVLTRPLEGSAYSRFYGKEQLYLTVPPFHPAAAYREISFEEMDGQNFIMYAHVGFWEEIVREKMPHSKFFLQNDLDAVGELARYSDLPSFSSNVSQQMMPSRRNGRIQIPFSDPESRVSYYLICRAEEKGKWKELFKGI